MGAKNGKIGDALAFLLPDTGSVYVEPFGGSFGVGKRLGTRYPVRIYNDLEPCALAVMRQLTSLQAEDFYMQAIQEIQYSPEYLKKCIGRFACETDPVQKGIYAWAILTLSYSGNGKCHKFATTSEAKKRYYRSMETRRKVLAMLRNVQVTEQDAMDCIRSHDVEGTVIYADPPYVLEKQQDNKLYHKSWDMQVQRQFLDTVCAVRHAAVLISGYDNELYNSRLKGWWRCDVGEVSKAIAAAKHGGKKPRAHEIVWANYSIAGGEKL